MEDDIVEPSDLNSDTAEKLFEKEEQEFTDLSPPQAGMRKGPSNAELERMYDLGTFRIITQRNDFLIPNLLQSMEQHQYVNLNPAYQRRLRWEPKRKSRLIESLLMNVPIPPVFLYEVDLARYEVVDGQQRLSTIREFFNNEFPLVGLETWSALNGRRFNSLPPRIQSGLTRRSLGAVILLAESGETSDPADSPSAQQREIKRLVFERLNTGGVRLNAQEIRNALHDSKFNSLLHELSRHSLFTSIWDVPPKERNEEHQPSRDLQRNTLYCQMLDCEIVLRFFTLADPEGLGSSMRASLDATMERHASDDAATLARLRQDYLFCLETAHLIYGAETFRLLPPRRPLSRALYDAVMIGIHGLVSHLDDENRQQVRAWWKSAADAIADATRQLLRSPASYELLVGRLNTRQSIIERIELLSDLYVNVLDGAKPGSEA